MAHAQLRCCIRRSFDAPSKQPDVLRGFLYFESSRPTRTGRKVAFRSGLRNETCHLACTLSLNFGSMLSCIDVACSTQLSKSKLSRYQAGSPNAGCVLETRTSHAKDLPVFIPPRGQLCEETSLQSELTRYSSVPGLSRGGMNLFSGGRSAFFSPRRGPVPTNRLLLMEGSRKCGRH